LISRWRVACRSGSRDPFLSQPQHDPPEGPHA